ncbi:Immunoglobulin-like domain [Trinorchestia longiramus]|nr:Immunoglobulin-like domain [Trinorchestia longiramus]
MPEYILCFTRDGNATFSGAGSCFTATQYDQIQSALVIIQRLRRMPIMSYDASGVTITRLSVPRAVLANTSSVTMDCVYTVPEDQRRGLVVKWYVDTVHLVYQWIPPQKPQALGLLSERVDTAYKAASESWSRHRAIRITKLDPTLSGDYSCTVSTYEDEDTRTSPLLVWVPSSSVRVRYWRISEHLVNVTCVARDIAPRPHFTLYTLFPDRTRLDDVSDSSLPHVSNELMCKTPYCPMSQMR